MIEPYRLPGVGLCAIARLLPEALAPLGYDLVRGEHRKPQRRPPRRRFRADGTRDFGSARGRIDNRFMSLSLPRTARRSTASIGRDRLQPARQRPPGNPQRIIIRVNYGASCSIPTGPMSKRFGHDPA